MQVHSKCKIFQVQVLEIPSSKIPVFDIFGRTLHLGIYVEHRVFHLFMKIILMVGSMSNNLCVVTCNVSFCLPDNPVHGGLRRRRPDHVEGQGHRLRLRPPRHLILRSSSGE